jgi:hypothetical protein
MSTGIRNVLLIGFKGRKGTPPVRKGFSPEGYILFMDIPPLEGAVPGRDPAPKKLDISRTLSGSLSNKMKILKDAIEEIDGLIQLRKALSESIYERVDREISGAHCERR